MLFALIVIPVFAALAIAFAPKAQARGLATVSSLVCLAVGVVLAFQFDWADAGNPDQFGMSIPVLSEMGISFTIGIDSISLWLIELTLLLAPICVIASYSAINKDVKTYYAWLTVLQAAMIGVFAARDLALFYTCFEFTLIPMWVMIHMFGSTNRKKAATKFFLFTFTGSVIALAGLVYVAWQYAQLHGEWSFAFDHLRAAARGMNRTEQGWVLLAMMAGFAVKVPLFPVHTWLPLAHTEAPTAGSVVLAGVLLKLGTYAIFRFVLSFVPDAVVAYAVPIAVLSIIGIIYAGLICWVQRDVKKLVAYSSVSHLGFCILGLFAINAVGMSGSVMYMINHGLSTGALFLCIGMMYERYHTRSMEEVGGLANKMPVWAFFMVFFTLASVGLPGLNGFVSEFLCLLGTFQSGAGSMGVGGTVGSLGPWFAAIAGTGMVVAAIYLLYMVGKIVFGELREPADYHKHDVLPADLNGREIGVLVPLALGCVVLGVLPTPMLKTLEQPINSVVATLEHSHDMMLVRGEGSEAVGDAVIVAVRDETEGGGGR
jgi:NADH-quinone oxidoreductase subunit M